MPTTVNILMTGVTGYIGGSVLARFLEHPNAASFKITALVRSAEKAEKLKALGVNAVVGSHSDETLTESLAAESDVVIAMADCDNLEAALGILKGLKKRHDATKTVPILIHTSGTGVLNDGAAGDHSTETIYDDANPDQIETLPDTQIHRNVDLEILRADKEGYIKSYIILPSTIWGIATGTMVDHGVQNAFSMQVPVLIRVSLARGGRGGMVGAGKNIWPNVNIEEVADFYIVLFNSIQTNPATGHGREGFYFLENGEHTLYDIGKAIAEALVKVGKSDNPEPSSFTNEEVKKFLRGSTFLGTNSRCIGNRSRAIGWKPIKTKDDFLASIKLEVEAIVNKVAA